MPMSAIRGRRHPHQVLIAAMCVLTGLPVLLGGPRPGSLTAALPLVLVYAWSATIAVGGALIVAAAITRNALTALYLELLGHLPVAIMAAVYGGALLAFTGTRGLAPAAIVLGAAASFGVRWLQIRQTFRELTAGPTKGPSE